MKKVVNNNVVDIKNIELFELAEEGRIRNSVAKSLVSEGIDKEDGIDTIRKYIKQYSLCLKSIPYPLYLIERDIKYAIIGNFITYITNSDINMWVENGLHIKINEENGMTLLLVNNTWGIRYIKQEINRDISLDKYSNEVGYKEFIWVLNKLAHKESTSEFYKEFMPDFISACDNKPEIIKNELQNVLRISDIPNKVYTVANSIIDYTNNKIYTFDIYSTGVIDTDEKTSIWSLSGDCISTSEKYGTIETYDFDLYVKNIGYNNKMEKCTLAGARNIFMEICGLKAANESNVFPVYRGVIFDSNLIFMIENKLFITKSYCLSKSKLIADSVSLHSVKNGMVYFTKSEKLDDTVRKDTIYTYRINDETIKICSIGYRN